MEKKSDIRKRRSKKEIEGRNHTCECGKSYLSYQALYTHKRTKHADPIKLEDIPKKKRGRPRGNNSQSSQYDPVSILGSHILGKKLSEMTDFSKATTCDEHFVEFISEKSKIFNKKEFKSMAHSIVNLRNCINKYSVELNDNCKEDIEYTSVKSSALLPKISNVYLFNYLPESKVEYDFESEVEFVMAYCAWLCDKNYTDLQLSLIN